MFILKTLRVIFITIDNIIFQLVDLLYQLFMMLAETGIFTTKDILDFSERIYFFLGLIMVFKVSISLLQYIMNPDAAQDGKIGAPKLLKNIVFVLAGIILVPYVFDAAFSLQRIVLSDNIIGNLILGTNYTDSGDSTDTNKVVKQAGDRMAFTTFTAFFHFNDNYIGADCYNAPYDENGNVTEACTKDPNYNDILEEFLDIDTKTGKLYKEAYKDMNMHKLALRPSLYNATFEADDGEDEFVFDYMLLVTSASGLFIAYILLVFCFDVAVRSVKLGFLQLIAPVPLIAKIDPKKGDEVFNKWVKECTSTYLNLFIRLVSIYFALYIISIVSVFNPYNVITKDDINNPFVKVFIILGTLLFVKDLPKLIETITGMKIDTKGFGIKNKLGQTPLVGGKLANGLSRLEGRARAGGRRFMQNRAGNMAKKLSGNYQGSQLSKKWDNGLTRLLDRESAFRYGKINAGVNALAGHKYAQALGVDEKLGKLNAKGDNALATSKRAYEDRIDAARREGMEREKSAGWFGDGGYKGTTTGKILQQSKFKERETAIENREKERKYREKLELGKPIFSAVEAAMDKAKRDQAPDATPYEIEKAKNEAKGKVLFSAPGSEEIRDSYIEMSNAKYARDQSSSKAAELRTRYEKGEINDYKLVEEAEVASKKANSYFESMKSDFNTRLNSATESVIKSYEAYTAVDDISKNDKVAGWADRSYDTSSMNSGNNGNSGTSEVVNNVAYRTLQENIDNSLGIGRSASDNGAPTAENSVMREISTADYFASANGLSGGVNIINNGGTGGSVNANISEEAMRQMAQVMSETYSHSTAAAMKDALSDVGRQLSQDIGASVKDAVSEPFNRLNQSMQNVSDSLSQVEKTQKNMAEVIDENTEAIEDSRKKNDDDK